MNTNELKKAMIDANVTSVDCAKALKISEQTFCKKLNGKTDFWRSEIVELSSFLNLSDGQQRTIFFS